ncbi:MAG TPA: hypothetical protein VIJ02_13140 [Thermoanaerobaculia bacterium]|jgi:hypothetical protein
MLGKRIQFAAFLVAGLALAACASTRIVESWKAPGTGQLHFQKVLAVAILKNQGLRQNAEDALKGNLKNVQAVQSYTMFDLGDLVDRDKAKERLRKEGFDGVVALRLTQSRQELSWTTYPTMPVDTFWGYYGAYYPAAEMRVDTVVMVEIKIYSLTDDKLVWAGVSETFNPTNSATLISEIAAEAAKELRRQGLIS